MENIVIDTNLWNDIKKQSKDFERQINPLQRKLTGSYYTDFALTDVMIRELVEKVITEGKKIYELKFLEPCVGTGNFVFSYIKNAVETGLTRKQIKKLVENIYVSDINNEAVEKYYYLLNEFLKTNYDIELEENYYEKHCGAGSLVDVTAEILRYIPISEVFPKEVIKSGFDIVVTNPPYKNLKAEADQYENKEDYEKDKLKYKSIAKIVDKNFEFSNDGVLNLYKLFVEEIIDKYSNDNAYVCLLIPSTILSDKTCEKLRTHILLDNCVYSVKLIKEGSGFIDAQQALTTLFIQKGKRTTNIDITKDFCESPNQIATVPLEDIIDEYTGNAVFAINSQEYTLLRKLRKFPVVKQLDYIDNKRGELDLTAYKDYITEEKTDYELLRGRNIGYYSLQGNNKKEYIKNEFVEKTKKIEYIKKDRIICQQVVNIHKQRRVTFAYIEPNYILGNSCNFISVKDNDDGIDLYSLLGLFNSSIINWLFKLTSSNNHVNNYEIDAFPVPVNSSYLYKISNLVKQHLTTPSQRIIDDIEKLVYKAYELDKETDDYEHKNDNKSESCENQLINNCFNDLRNIIKKIDIETLDKTLKGVYSKESLIIKYGNELSNTDKAVALGIIDKYIRLNKSEILNHTTFKLSNLDMEMIKSVPQGGSWKNIPMSTVEKSKRLLKITQTGGRTTLYGRIDYNQPSYTITTYFNRPGNGTYIHPIHDRVLSVREAARFQTFRDDFYFYGNKTQLLKQVGNAVPTVLAYQLAKNIINTTGCRKSIDLFCGAGGMTIGFKEAGIHSLLCNDIEESACISLKINCPELDVFKGDITNKQVKDHIVEIANKYGADIICGGPPCQGFSMAGFRLDNDPRNQLFRDFVEIVQRVKPKVIVFENVEGLLTYQNGSTYEAILELFDEVGYNAEGRTLMTNHYAVPQKRKRVIIICTSKELDITPDAIFPKTITFKAEHQITAKEAISDLENIPCGEKTEYHKQKKESDFLRLMRKEISYDDYLNLNYYSDEENNQIVITKAKKNLLKNNKSVQLALNFG